jgi:hypothetical protein
MCKIDHIYGKNLLFICNFVNTSVLPCGVTIHPVGYSHIGANGPNGDILEGFGPEFIESVEFQRRYTTLENNS